MFALMALSIYDGMMRTRQLRRIVRAGLQLDLFDRKLLTPLARWGQSVSLMFVGGTCLSLLSPGTPHMCPSTATERRRYTISCEWFGSASRLRTQTINLRCAQGSHNLIRWMPADLPHRAATVCGTIATPTPRPTIRHIASRLRKRMR